MDSKYKLMELHIEKIKHDINVVVDKGIRNNG